MPWFLKNSLKTLLSQRKVVKPCNNVKIPPFSLGHWNRCRPRASKTALGPRATLYGPWAVLEALGRHLFQSPSEKGGILAQNAPCSETIAFWAECPPVRKLRHSGSTVFQNAPCLKRGILKNYTPRMPWFSSLSWIKCFPPNSNKSGKTM